MAGERVVHTRRADVEAYITKDGSVIRELMHPNVHGNANESIAEAIVAPGQSTYLHKYILDLSPFIFYLLFVFGTRRHHRSEEIYHITAGSGTMELGGKQFAVHAGDTVCIDPGTEHCVTNTSDSAELKLVAVSAPPYQHRDTELTGQNT